MARMSRTIGRNHLGGVGAGRALMLAAASGALFFAASPGEAHDEDWRKLADRQEPYVGEIYRAGRGGESPLAASAGARNASNLTLLSQVPTSQFGGGDGSDCWGYVSPSGREYALVGAASGLGVIEITDPTNPQVIAFIDSANSFWHDVKVIGEYAYHVNESGNGIQVIDLSNIDNGVVTKVQDKQQGGHTTTHNIVAHVETGYLYLTGANVANGGLVAVDTNADPADPTFAGSWNNRYVHDAQVVIWQHGAYAGREIAFCFNGEFGVEVIDVTDKGNMTRIGGSSYPALRYCHQGWLSPDQQYLYVNDELDEGNSVSVTTTRVFRVHDPAYSGPAGDEPSPANPVFVGTFSTGVAAVDHNLYTLGNLIFQANYRSGLRVFDASQDPENPTQVAFFDTYLPDDDARFNGAWSVYPYFPSGNIIVSDIEQGLLVLELDDSVGIRVVTLDVTSVVPERLDPGQTLDVVVSAEVSGVTPLSNGYKLAVNAGGGPDTLLPLSPTGNAGEFSATIGPFDCPSYVRFRAVLETQEGITYDSPQFEVNVFDSEEQLVDGEATADAWTTGGSASAGGWDFGTPVDAGRGDPPVDADGTGVAWLTQNDFGPNGDGNSDVDGGEVSLVTEAYDLSGGAEVTYFYWLNDVPNGALSPEDFFRVEVQIDGDSWQVAREYVAASSAWRSDVISFGAGGDFPAAASVRFRFSAADFGSGGVIEAGLDGFTITGAVCDASNCAADLDGSGGVGTADLLLLLAAWGSGAGGDTTGDGQTGTADLLELLSEWGRNDC